MSRVPKIPTWNDENYPIFNFIRCYNRHKEGKSHMHKWRYSHITTNMYVCVCACACNTDTHIYT